MKTIALFPIAIFLAGCYSTNPDAVEYREVVTTSCCKQTPIKNCCHKQYYKTVNTCCKYRAVAPCCGHAAVMNDYPAGVVTILDEEPIDVTTTYVDYY